ncbi:hypothetical protein QA639_14750 [Bradyrhizobium pachyrhizi]|uniref:hypothetical protein n=1 Tax=Bradyrhizobium pachyrhizi TaxID=280333 RepID=UPI001FD23B6A|nr:hypothetical protein [Bradyrhizobium pachyrhizi]WFU58675.1 hypothetical protein QA639_14750 [Bradyrhizobium pachyrhizi]
MALRTCLLAEARGKSLALSRLRRGRGRDRSANRRCRRQSLPAGNVGLLRTLLALQQAVLRLQGTVMDALRACALDLLRLQLLHALLQAIDPGLPLSGLARERVTLPLLRRLLALLDHLLVLLRALLNALRRRRPLAQARSWARA